MAYGAHNVLITNPRDIPDFLKTMKKFKPTVMPGVNTLFNALLNRPEFADMDLSHLKISVAGATALQDAVAQKWLATTKSPWLKAMASPKHPRLFAAIPLMAQIAEALLVFLFLRPISNLSMMQVKRSPWVKMVNSAYAAPK